MSVNSSNSFNSYSSYSSSIASSNHSKDSDYDNDYLDGDKNAFLKEKKDSILDFTKITIDQDHNNDNNNSLTEKENNQFKELYGNFKKLNPPMQDKEIQVECEKLVKLQRKIYDHFIRFNSTQLPRGSVTDGKNVAYVHAKTKGGAKMIGEGYFNQAFLGYRLDFQTGNVIEVIHRKLKNSKYFEATQKELELQKKFQSHPNIVQVYDYIPY